MDFTWFLNAGRWTNGEWKRNQTLLGGNFFGLIDGYRDKPCLYEVEAGLWRGRMRGNADCTSRCLICGRMLVDSNSHSRP